MAKSTLSGDATVSRAATGWDAHGGYWMGRSGMSDPLVIRPARPDDEPEVMRAHRATTADVPGFLHGYRDGMPFVHYLAALDAQERGADLQSDHVPSTFLFAFVGSRVVGRITIRHRLTDALMRLGGHIGYVVVPDCRRRGYATTMLRLALGLARDRLGLERVLLTCDEDNIASIRTIERNGGVLESVLTGPDRHVPIRRYWIQT